MSAVVIGFFSLELASTVYTQVGAALVNSRNFLSHPLIRVCVKVGVCVRGPPDSVLCQENVAEVHGFLHNSMNDYMVDSRGDVGAW